MVHEIAESFRLNVVSSVNVESPEEEEDESDVQRAAKVLLDLYASLRRPLPGKAELRIPVITGDPHA
jgi:hypothetical protein